MSATFVDEGGHFAQEVRIACRERFDKMVFAIKGSSGGQSVPYTAPPRKVKIVIKGRSRHGLAVHAWRGRWKASKSMTICG